MNGKRVLSAFGEPVICVREFWKLSTSQREALRNESVYRHVWKRYPLSGHAVLFMTRA